MAAESNARDRAKGLALLIFVFASLWQGLSGAGLLKDIDPRWVALVASACTIVAVPLVCLAYGLACGQEMSAWRGQEAWRERLPDLIYPFLIWSVIVGVFEVFGSGARTKSTSLSDLHDVPWNPHGVFWLPYTLYLSIGLTAMLKQVLGMRLAEWLIVPVGLVLLALFPWAPHVLTAREVCMCFVFFAIGVLMAGKLPLVRASWPAVLMASAALLLALYVGHTQMDGATTSVRAVTPNAALLATCVLALSVWMVLSMPKAWAWLAYLGQRFMPLYLMHLLFVVAARMALGKVLHVQSVPVYIVVGMPIGVIGPLLLLTLARRTALRHLFEPPAFLRGKHATQQPA
jgi:fucose 4-O-acetylase-like acetyltransferase